VRSWVPMDTTRYGDSNLWILFTVCGYLKFTNDLALLDEVVPYLDGGQGTVMEHLERAVSCSDNDRGPNGLVRIRFADWNDALNPKDPQAESVFCTMAFGRGLKEMEALMRHLARGEQADKYARMHADLKETVNRVAWDEAGGFYVRAFADGKVIGGTQADVFSIFLNPQTWGILGDMVPPERLAAVLKTIDEKLDTDFGSAVNLPGYEQWNERLGRITAQLPGTGENSGAYCHVTGFKMAADVYIGRGDRALASLKKIMPGSDLNPVERSGGTPFALTSSYYLSPSPAGRAGRPWLTGTQCWFMHTVVEGLLGVRRTYGGFRMAPALPSAWPAAEVDLTRGKDIYRVRIRRDKAAKGVSVTLNGKPLSDNFVPFQKDGTHEVVVTVP